MKRNCCSCHLSTYRYQVLVASSVFPLVTFPWIMDLTVLPWFIFQKPRKSSSGFSYVRHPCAIVPRSVDVEAINNVPDLVCRSVQRYHTQHTLHQAERIERRHRRSNTTCLACRKRHWFDFDWTWLATNGQTGVSVIVIVTVTVTTLKWCRPTITNEPHFHQEQPQHFGYHHPSFFAPWSWRFCHNWHFNNSAIYLCDVRGQSLWWTLFLHHHYHHSTHH